MQQNRFLQRDGAELVLTAAGEQAVVAAGDTDPSPFAEPARLAAGVATRFDADAPINEETLVEETCIAQLRRLGWEHIAGDRWDPGVTGRESFREVLLHGRFRDALRRINPDAEGQRWLDERRADQAIGALERRSRTDLLAANEGVTDLLRRGALVEGEGEREQRVQFIDFEHPDRNDFLAINQFRADPPGGRAPIIPDLVLFVNGIPLVVIECKSPLRTNPVEEAITQLLRYANLRGVESDEGVEALFRTNLLQVATCFYEARVGALGSGYEHFLEWKDTAPVPQSVVAEAEEVATLSSQQLLVAGLLRPAHLLETLRHFTLFRTSGGKQHKIIPRYQQFRAVYRCVERLREGRDGIVWHTQGSGKSLTMVFLIRKMRTLYDLQSYKVVVVTDRIDLEEQLAETAALTGETVRRTNSVDEFQTIVSEDAPDLVFAMLQKAQDAELVAEEDGAPRFPILNTSERILILVDEGHRSHSRTLHANLRQALPNAKMIAFTGTPILLGDRKLTQEIFGGFIDRYIIAQAEQDGETVPIIYEGRRIAGVISDPAALDARFKAVAGGDVGQAGTRAVDATAVLEAGRLIEAKARDMLRHYAATVLPDGFKAMVVAVSRRAAVRYQAALAAARDELVARLDEHPGDQLALDEEGLARQGDEERALVAARRQRDRLAGLQFAAVISQGENDEGDWRRWTEPQAIRRNVEDFRKPFDAEEEEKRSSLAFLCVNNMLITGFDAPALQVLYLDRPLREHGLLQAIARVNRTHPNKQYGLVVDYYGVARNLKEALAVYSAEDVKGAVSGLPDELPLLEDRHRRAVGIFTGRGLDLDDLDGCLRLLQDVEIRADFAVKLKDFMASLDVVLPRPQGLRFLPDARRLGRINQVARVLYRDNALNLLGVGRKVRALIDEYVVAAGSELIVAPIAITCLASR